MSFPWATNKCLRRDCEPPALCEPECEPCCDDFKCLQIEHTVIEACPPSRLAHIFEKVAMTPAVGLLPPISYIVDLRFTNRTCESMRLEHIYSSLAQPSKWSAVDVRIIEPDCTVSNPIVIDGDLLGATGPQPGFCIGPCQSLQLTVCLVGHCRFDCADPNVGPVATLGGVACTVIKDVLLICGVQPCSTWCEDVVGNGFRKRFEYCLPN